MYKKILALVLVGLFLIGLASSSLADSNLDIGTKWRLFNAESKNPWLAVGVAWLCPTLGHAYAGDWVRGLPFLGSELLGLGLMTSSISSTATSINTGQYSLGLVLFLGARIWEYIDAYGTAEEFNKKLKGEYGLTLQLRHDSPVLAYTYNF